MDSYWINCLFRPMVTLTQPVPPSELELEEGIEMLIERLAVPNLWLQPDTSKDYIKDLPVWKFRGWDPLVSKPDGKSINKMQQSPEMVEKMMDGEDPYEMPSHDFSVHCHGCTSEMVKYRQEFGASSRKKNGKNCMELHQRNVEQTHHNCCACHVDFPNISAEACSAFDRCQICGGRKVRLRRSENFQTRVPYCLCVDRQTVPDRLVSDVTSDSDTLVSSKWDLGNVKDSLSCSDESGDEATCPPPWMRPTTGCVICLESYKCGDLLCGLPCGHNYHTCCIILWLRKENHDDCPVCRWPAYRSKHSLSHLHSN